MPSDSVKGTPIQLGSLGKVRVFVFMYIYYLLYTRFPATMYIFAYVDLKIINKTFYLLSLLLQFAQYGQLEDKNGPDLVSPRSYCCGRKEEKTE